MIRDRDTYIQNNDLEETLNLYLSYFKTIDTEIVDAINASGRVLSKAVYAKVCDPTYNASAMDGIAVHSQNTLEATDLKPKVLKKDEFQYVNTGNPLPSRFDSVIMIEDCLIKEDGCIAITEPSRPWQHVRVHGESVVVSEMILPSNRKVRPLDIGALIASGNDKVEVYRKPRVAIIPTGNEMVESVDLLDTGKLMESNTRVFSALTIEYGGIPNRLDIVKDEKELLEDTIKNAVKDNDVVIINAGSSVGTKDFTAKIIEKLGTIVAHGLAIKPGKPTILGIIDGKPVIGVPGYPVSAYLVYDLVVQALLNKLIGLSVNKRPSVKAILTKRLFSTFKNKEYIRVALGSVNGKIVASPLDRGAASLMSMVKADGLLTIDRLVEGIEVDSEVSVELLKPMSEIEKSLVITGSHDVVIDVISDYMPVTSAHVGSLSGIFALKSKSCHIAPIHLLDHDTGVYNEPYVRKYFPNEKMVLIKGLGRIQGIVVPKGNPKGIKTLEALKDKSIRFANRQNGAGTRLLFDYKLKELGINACDVNGYDKEFTTHLAVVDAVKNGVADMGLAVLSAAKILDVDFIPIASESYDFLLSEATLKDPRVQKFIEILKSKEFAAKVDELGGYDLEGVGELRFIG